MLKIAVLYSRVSTADQAREGVSLDMQHQRASGWATANGYTLAARCYSDEGISGKRADNRPGLQAALTEVCRTRGALVVYSLSRLARSTRDAIDIGERLAKCGADLVSLSETLDTTSAAGKMMFRLLAVFAEFERDLAVERTSAAMSHKRSKGERLGEVPYGYKASGPKYRCGECRAEFESAEVQPLCRACGAIGRPLGLSPVLEEQTVLAQIQGLRRNNLSWENVAEILNQNGIPTKKGVRWSGANVRKVTLGTKGQNHGRHAETSRPAEARPEDRSPAAAGEPCPN